MRQPSILRPVITAGLTAGTLDIVGASLQYYIKTGKGPGNMLRFIASGVFGTKAFSGGAEMAGLGLLFHYIITFLFTIFFFWLYPRTGILQKNAILTGLLYGRFIWAVMNLVVFPLSSAPVIPFVLKKAVIAMLIFMCCAGLPIALIADKYYLYKK
ncbi:MAG: hypothetical protein FJY20_01985 [Bacteroidetes bacterium]|nr:hypothetical protein [Bacteroidota bacterium]